MDSFSPPPPLSGLFLGPAWPCEIEVSHMGKSLPHIGKGGRRSIFVVYANMKDPDQPMRPGNPIKGFPIHSYESQRLKSYHRKCPLGEDSA